MSELAKTARVSMKDKIARLLGFKKNEKVDSSDYTPPADMEMSKPRPISRMAFKEGGKVEGENCAPNAGKSPRKKAKADGGQIVVPTERFKFNQGMQRTAGLKTGGRANQAEIDAMERERAITERNMRNAQLPKDLGSLEPDGDEIPAFRSRPKAKASPPPPPAPPPAPTSEKKEIPDWKPVPRKGGGKIKKAGGGDIAAFLSPAYAISQGKLPGLNGMMIDKLGGKKSAQSVPAVGEAKKHGGRTARKSGGRAKTNINIIIGSPKDKEKEEAEMMPKPPVMPIRPPVMSAPPPQAGAPAPMPMPPMQAPSGGAPLGNPPMARKSGGRAGAGSGLGRLGKIKSCKP